MDNKVLREMKYSINTISLLLACQLEVLKRKATVNSHKEQPYLFLDTSSFINELEMAETITTKESRLLGELNDKLRSISSRRQSFEKLKEHDKVFSISVFYDLDYSENLFSMFRLRKREYGSYYEMYLDPNTDLKGENVTLKEWIWMDKYRFDQDYHIFYGSEKLYKRVDFLSCLNKCEELLQKLAPYIEEQHPPFNHNYTEEEIKLIAAFLMKTERIKKSDEDLFRDIMNGRENSKKINWLKTQEDLKTFALYIQEAIYNDLEAKVIPVKKGGSLNLKELNRFFTVKGRTLTKGRHDISIPDLYDFFKSMNKIKD